MKFIVLMGTRILFYFPWSNSADQKAMILYIYNLYNTLYPLPESSCDTNEDTLPVVSDDSVCVQRKDRGDEDHDHDVGERHEVVLKVAAYPSIHAFHVFASLPGVVVAHPDLVPIVGDNRHSFRRHSDQPLDVNDNLQEGKKKANETKSRLF